MNTQNLQKSLLISVEGIDGAGKSSLVQALASLLDKHNFTVLATKEPGGTSLGKALRNLLLHSNETICPKAQYLLFAADRAEHFHRIVLPALAQNTIVISDRMNDSSVAYQAYGNEINKEMIATIDRWTMEYKEPDIVFYVKVDIETALKRIAYRGEQTNNFEQKNFLEKVLLGFEAIFRKKQNIYILNGQEDQTLIAQKAFNHIIQWLYQTQN